MSDEVANNGNDPNHESETESDQAQRIAEVNNRIAEQYRDILQSQARMQELIEQILNLQNMIRNVRKPAPGG